VVLVLFPGSGDSIQALKAGVMEIPDVIVVNKAEHPLADSMVREIKGVLALGRAGSDSDWRVPVLRTEAIRGAGIEELADTLVAHRAHIEASGTLQRRRARNLMGEVLAIATLRIRRDLEARLHDDAEVRALLERVAARELDPASAAEEILERERERGRG
jgi:LAO/AO transport system kinase